MKERPIIFSGELVPAILTCANCGTITLEVYCPKCGSTKRQKSQTRRTRGLEAVNEKPGIWTFLEQIENEYHFGHGDPNGDAWGEGFVKCPYGVVGDKLWVRETWMLYNHMGTFIGNIPKQSPKDLSVGYKADGLDRENLFSWRSSRFMPKWAARIWLEIKNIRVERVQDISEEDCFEEGINLSEIPGIGSDMATIKAFSELWDSLNAKRGYGWDKNSWVWVIEFKVKA